MSDLQSQLDLLRRRIARIDQKYASGAQAVQPATAQLGAATVGITPEPVVEPLFPQDGSPMDSATPEDWLPGEEIANSGGVHFQTTRFWARHRRHGSMDISELSELPHDLLDAVSEGTVPPSPPQRWVYLDTETTGLAGGSGTYAFLIGIGYVTAEGFHLKQYFLRNPGEEASALEALKQDLEEFDVLVTYNGKAYDQPLLETRYRMTRQRPPFDRLAHMDLLYGSRRLWKLRLESCRLVELESQILGVEREGDVPGELIPYLYFDYLRKQEIFRLVPVFHHNAIDILTLACLTAIVPYAFRDPSEARLKHGAEMVGIARWMRKADRLEEAVAWMRAALGRKMKDDLLFRTMWDIAQLERKLGREQGALSMYTELASCRNPHRVEALEELAKHYEHKERNPVVALAFTEQALKLCPSPELQHRAARLERKLASRTRRSQQSRLL
jgi:uncharacterized protein YprB with RNaseH-like and TPR domain